jgi:hypothetical protein
LLDGSAGQACILSISYVGTGGYLFTYKLAHDLRPKKTYNTSIVVKRKMF